MAAARIGALRVDLGLNTAAFQKGLTESERRLNAFKGKMGKFANSFKAAANVMAVGVGVATAAVVGLVAATDQVARQSREMANAARIAGEGFEEFQRQAFAARTVGIETEKLADIFKDVRERVGEFVVNGGGPLQDAFDALRGKVRLTVDELRGLSGKDALQLIVQRMQEARLSTEEMSFVLESLGSDATALLPLLQDNARAFDELGKSANVLTDADREQLERYTKAKERLGQAVQGLTVRIGNELVPALIPLIEALSDSLKELSKLNISMGDAAAIGQRLANMVRGMTAFFVSTANAVRGFNATVGRSVERISKLVDVAVAALNPLTTLLRVFERIGAVSGGSGGGASGTGNFAGRYLDFTKQAPQSVALLGATTKGVQGVSKSLVVANDNFSDLLDRMRPIREESRRLVADLKLIDAQGFSEGVTKALRLERVSNGSQPSVDILSNPERALEKLTDASGVFTSELGRNAKEIGQKNGEILDSFDQMANGAISALQRLTNSLSGGGFLDILGSAIGLFSQLGSTGLFGDNIKSSFGGARAMGGPVSAGQTYLVGEKGPELFNPGRSGSIIPNHKLGGGQAANNNHVTIGFDASMGSFNAYVDGRIVAAGPSIASAGAALAQGQAAQAASRSFR